MLNNLLFLKSNEAQNVIRKRIIPIVIALFFCVVSLTSIAGKTNTTDESSHMIRGIMLLKTGDFRLNQHHPILFNVINSIPAVLNPELKTESLDSENWQQAKKDEMGSNLIELNGGIREFSQNILFPARISMVVIVSLFLIWFYKVVYDAFNFNTALVATLCLALSPTLLAHGALVTTDAPSLMTIFAGSWGLYKYFESKGAKKWLAVFILLSFVALITKYTTVFVAVLWLGLLLHYEFFISKQTVSRKLMKFFIVPLAWLLMLTAAYAFQFRTLEQMQYGNQFFINATLDFITSTGKGFDLINIPGVLQNIYHNWRLPFPQYVIGFIDNVIKHDIYGHKSYLLRQFSQNGWWYYFPVAFAAKETLSFVLLTIVTIFYFVVRLIKSVWKKSLKYSPKIVFVAVPVFLMLISLASSINLGIRHLLPIYPFLAIGVGIVASEAIKRSDSAKRMLIALFIFAVLSVFSQYPHYIEYFNEVAGGPNNGFLIVRDSNFDWDQNNGAALTYVEQHKNAAFYYDELEDGGQWVVRVEQLFGNPKNKPEELARLYDDYMDGKIKPIGQINHTFWIFEIEKP